MAIVDAAEVFQIWQQLVPSNVSVVAGPMLKRPAPLAAREYPSAGRLQAERRQEFESGRTYAKRALSMLGIHDVDLPVASDRSPLWPEGIVGSIVHWTDGSEGHVAAAVARTRDICAIGIDVERDDPLHPSMWHYVLGNGELQRLLAVQPQLRAHEAQVLWSAKEAVVKATCHVVEPTQIDVEYDRSNGSFVAHLRARQGKWPVRWHGRTVRLQGMILAAVIRPALNSKAN
jgi:4'-phosphopantetheinyl transferase EntD